MTHQVRKYQGQILTSSALAKASGGTRSEYILAGRYVSVFYIVSILIVYGSLYPFNFSVLNTSSADIENFLGSWGGLSRRGDVLGNIALFVPFGACGMLALVPARSPAARFVLLSLIGFFLASGLQVLQLFLPTRDPALADIGWNLIGGAAGALLVWPAGIRVRLLAHAGTDVPLFPLLLLACWLAGELAPFVPSTDLQSFKDSLKPLFETPDVVSPLFLRTYMSWLVVFHLVTRLWPDRAGLRWLVCAAAAVVAAKIVIVQNDVGSSYVLAVLLALLSWSLLLCGLAIRVLIILLGAVALLVVASLEPFALREVAQDFSWVPFSGALTGSILTNVKAVAAKVFLLGSLLYLMEAVGLRTVLATALVVLLAAVLEVAQIWVGQHTPEITDPSLALFLGALMAAFHHGAAEHGKHQVGPAVPPARGPEAVRPSPRPEPAAARVDRETPRRDRLFPTRRALFIALSGCVAAALAMRIVLGLPQIPYNLRELFGGEDAWWSLFLFSLAILSIGLGGAYVGRVAAMRGRAYLILPAGTVAACLVTYLLLVPSVSAESLWDITGSSNTYWFVMNRHIWGDAGVWLYEAIGSRALIQAVERFVRFTALFGQALLWIAILSAVYFRLAGASRADPRATARLALTTFVACLLGAAPWLVLFNLVAFDFSSTDNLNELLDGHGHISYLLLILLPLNALFIVDAIRRPRLAKVVGAVLVLAASLPIGWLLLKNGLSPVVTKYGKVFSGVDFLLGPDREELLPDTVLMVRWFAVQGAAIATLAFGMQLVPEPVRSTR